MSRPTLADLLAHMAHERLGQLTLIAGAAPAFTHLGVSVHAEQWRAELSKQDVQEMVYSVLFDEQRKTLSDRGELTTEFAVNKLGRFRVKARCDDAGAVSATFELIPAQGDAPPWKNPVVYAGVEPVRRIESDRLVSALTRIAADDAALQFGTDPENGGLVLFGMGEPHLEAVVERLKREFQIETKLAAARVAYKETIRESVSEEGRFQRSGNFGEQYGHCVLMIDPLPAGRGFVFRNELKPEQMPGDCVAAIEEGVREAAECGVVAGYPLTDLLVSLVSGPYNQRFNAAACKLAGAMALRSGCKSASPVILEPVMKCEIAAPERFSSEILADLEQRRATIDEVGELGSSQRIRCAVPASQLFGYAGFLRAMTRNLGAFAMEPSHFEAISPAQWKAENDPHSPDEPPTASAGRPVVPTRPRPGIPGGAKKKYPPESD